MACRLRFYATPWSLRQYPSAARQWSWPRKFRAIREAGFTGVTSPPIPKIRDRGDLQYLSITSIDRTAQIAPAFRAVTDLGANAIVVKLGDYDTPLPAALELVRALTQESRDTGLRVEIETHRDTYTETPENTWALADAWRQETGSILPICFDFSHFVVVRHLAPPYWPRLSECAELISHARTFHLRPCNGHHCQIPATGLNGRRAAEYRPWLEFVAALFAFSRIRICGTSSSSPNSDMLLLPMACPVFPIRGGDARVVHDDMRRLARQSGILEAPART